jgi:hypothetical protein
MQLVWERSEETLGKPKPAWKNNIAILPLEIMCDIYGLNSTEERVKWWLLCT